MANEMPKDPFKTNPLIELDNEALAALEAGVEYFELFGDVFYGHVHEYAKMYVEALVEEQAVSSDDFVDIDVNDLATLVVHGLMIGVLSQQSEGFIEELQDNI